jgi:hypothetical protein
MQIVKACGVLHEGAVRHSPGGWACAASRS